MKLFVKFLFFVFFISSSSLMTSQAIIINHENAFLEPIPEWAIKKASDELHIAYGHTSHGSQITYGMKALANQSTDLKGYKGDFYCWQEYHEVYGDNPCLDIDDGFRPGDLGHNGDITWANRTRDYLLNEDRAMDINVVMWSWCGGCSDNTDEGIQAYLDAMNNLENDFPNIKFVYMTGHLDHWSDATLKRNNQLIRDYCVANNKILYDFADIESYDPDGNYYEFSNDNCDYYDASGNNLGNWAEEWQNSHVLGEDWYQCSAAHTKALNGNRKAFAAWWLWARLIGWNPNINNIDITQQPLDFELCDTGKVYFSVDYNNADSIRWQVKDLNNDNFSNLFDGNEYSNTSSKILRINVENYNLNGFEYRCAIYLNDTVNFSNPASLTIYELIHANPVYDDEVCEYSILLKGNDPAPGTSEWTVMQGSANIPSPFEYETQANNLSKGLNIFRYTIINGKCIDTLDISITKYDSISILGQSMDANVQTSEDFSLEVNSSGDLEYSQWYKNSNIITDGNKYLGTNSTKLTIRNIVPEDAGFYYCNLYGYCNTLKSDTIQLSVISASEDIEKESIVVYPNPVKDIMYIQTDNEIEEIKVLNINTKELVKLDKFPENNKINISDLKQGVYLLKITINGKTIYHKVIKL